MKNKLIILKDLDQQYFEKVVNMEGELISMKRLIYLTENSLLINKTIKEIKEHIKTNWEYWELDKEDKKKLKKLTNILKQKYYDYYLTKARFTYNRKKNYKYAKENEYIKGYSDFFLKEYTYFQSLNLAGIKYENEELIFLSLNKNNKLEI